MTKTVTELATSLDAHEQVCGERSKNIELQFSGVNARLKRKATPGFEPMETCILDGDKVTIIHIGLRETIFERNGKWGRTWQYIPSSKISNHELRRVVGDDRMLDHKINGDV